MISDRPYCFFRNIALALGWVILVASISPSSKEVGNNLIRGASEKIERTREDAKQPLQHDKPCTPAYDYRSSDLCAQWKAADAAKSAADAAWWIGGFGLLIGAFTLGAAIAAAIYARKAATETKRGADAAIATIEETRAANALAQSVDRPWINISGEIEAYRLFEGSTMQIRMKISATNIGRMAAEDTQIEYHMIAVPRFMNELDNRIAQMRRQPSEVSIFQTIIPDKDRWDICTFNIEVNSVTTYGTNNPRIRVIILAYCRYRIPGENHFRESIIAWHVKRVRTPFFLPPNTILAPNIGLLVSELPTLNVEDMKLAPIRIEAT